MGPVKRMAGWNTWAKQNVMPTSVASSATRSGGSSRLTPRAARTSAEPDLELAARLPCLTTVSPAPAATIDAIVEMLTVWWPSPPVPTMSSVRPGTSMRTACCSIADARPVTSPTDSPLVRSAMRNAAMWTSDASSLRIWSMTHSASFASRSCLAMSRARISGQVSIALPSVARHPRADAVPPVV